MVMVSVTFTDPVLATRPTSLRARSISMTCSARSLGSAISSSARRASSSGVAPRLRVPASGRIVTMVLWRSVSLAISWRTRISGDEPTTRSEEHTSELKSLMRNSFAGFCLKKKKNKNKIKINNKKGTDTKTKKIKNKTINRDHIKNQHNKSYRQIYTNTYQHNKQNTQTSTHKQKLHTLSIKTRLTSQ